MEKFCTVEDLKNRSSLKMIEKYKKYFRKDIYKYITEFDIHMVLQFTQIVLI